MEKVRGEHNGPLAAESTVKTTKIYARISLPHIRYLEIHTGDPSPELLKYTLLLCFPVALTPFFEYTMKNFLCLFLPFFNC